MASVGSTPTGGNYSIRQIFRIRSSSWTLNAAKKLYTGVAQWKRAVKHRPLSFNHLWFDLRMVMDHTPEDVGSKPTTGIHTLFFTLHHFSLVLDIFSFYFIPLKNFLFTLSLYTLPTHSFHFDGISLIIPSAYLFACFLVIHHSFR